MKETKTELLPADAGVTDAELELMPRANGIERFKPLSALVQESRMKIAALEIAPADSPEEQKRKSAEARRLRLDVFKATRIAAGKVHKDLKAGILKIGGMLDAAEREIRRECEEIEEQLEAIEQHAQRERDRIEQETRARRAAEISPFLNAPLAVDLGKISEEDFQRQLADAKDLHTLRLERERKAAEEAAAKAKAEAEERERLAREAEERRLEVERLKAEAKAREEERLREMERLRKEQQAREAEERRLREEAEERSRRELAALAEKNRLEQAAREAEARKERERLAAEAQKEREARAKLEQEAREKAEAERRQREAEAAERRRAAAAPDAEKLRAWAEQLLALPLPELSPAAKAARAELAARRQGFANWIDKLADGLGGVQ